jgi:hypothetical protein
MKTAMQIAVESYKNDGVSFTDWFLDNYEMLLEKEKEQIISAYNDGVNDGNTQGLQGKEGNGNYATLEEYYKQTYNQNK